MSTAHFVEELLDDGGGLKLLLFGDGPLVEEDVYGILDVPLGSDEVADGLGLGGGGGVPEVFDELGLLLGVVLLFLSGAGLTMMDRVTVNI